LQDIAGYTLQRAIHEGAYTRVYAGVTQPGEQPVVVKLLKAEYPSLEEITRLKHEFSILDGLDSPEIIKALALEPHQNGLALVLEDFGGIALSDYLGQRPLSSNEFLAIALQLTAALAVLHQNQIVHKDLNPRNILIHPASGQVKLIDFDIASRLSRENLTASRPTMLEGTLAYLSPEQTGA
jgi:serine/threonine protein kinase